MKHITRHIQQWVRKGIITDEQAQKISQFEAVQSNPNWAISGFMLIGFFVFAVGIIAIIAANWKEIPDIIKLFVDFSLLGFIGYHLVKMQQTNRLLFYEGLTLFYMLSVLASIGLLTQIYHLTGPWYDTLCYWSLATLFIAVMSRGIFIPWLWTLVFTISAGVKLASFSADTGLYTEKQAIYSLMIAFPFVTTILANMLRSLKWDERFAHSFRWFAMVAAIIAVSLADITINESEYLAFITLIPSLLLTIIVVAFILVRARYTMWQKFLLKLMILAYLGMYLIACFAVELSILGAVFTILIYSIAALFFATTQQRGMFNLMTLLVGLRFIIVYLNQLYSLATTGFGLMLAGILIIGMVYLWQRYKDKLLQWAEELAR